MAHCGVVQGVGEIDEPANEPFRIVKDLLGGLQNRGQDSAGFAVVRDPERQAAEERVSQYRGEGTVEKAVSHDTVRENRYFPGVAAMGHVRYGTDGAINLDNAHPVHAWCDDLDTYWAVNGEIDDAFLDVPSCYETEASNDTGTIARLFLQHYDEVRDAEIAALETYREIQGLGMTTAAFTLDDRDLDAIYTGILKDGGRPLAHASTEIDGDTYHLYASETMAFRQITDRTGIAEADANIVPWGTIRVHDLDDNTIHETTGLPSTPLCYFEAAYISDGRSVFKDGVEGQEIRYVLGEELAKEHPLPQQDGKLPNDVVVGSIPNSGITYGRAYAHFFGVEPANVIVRNERTVDGEQTKRSFIAADQRQRKQIASGKFSLGPSWQPREGKPDPLDGKRLYLVDDSIVRGTVLQTVTDLFRGAGDPDEVHILSGNPPILAPCGGGIDMHADELIARRMADEYGHHLLDYAEDHTALEQEIPEGIDGLSGVHYLSTEGRDRAFEQFNIPLDDLCVGCTTGAYNGRIIPSGDGIREDPRYAGENIDFQ